VPLPTGEQSAAMKRGLHGEEITGAGIAFAK
jgi:hypothetical protein